MMNEEDEDEDFGPITPEVLERREQIIAQIRMLTGIDRDIMYLPGIVTLNSAPSIIPNMPERNLILVAWKIDDVAWKIHTSARAFISDNDPDARPGRYSFTEDSYSWVWGMEPFLDMEPAIALRDRILRLTTELGITLESREAEI